MGYGWSIGRGVESVASWRACGLCCGRIHGPGFLHPQLLTSRGCCPGTWVDAKLAAVQNLAGQSTVSAAPKTKRINCNDGFAYAAGSRARFRQAGGMNSVEGNEKEHPESSHPFARPIASRSPTADP